MYIGDSGLSYTYLFPRITISLLISVILPSLEVQWLRLYASTAGSSDLILGQGTRIPEIAQLVKEKKKVKLKYNHNRKGPPGKLEKEMATHASVLAWRIPWTEEPGRQQSMGSQESVTT